MILQSAFEDTGFPAGYFIIRSVATNRLLDVTMDDIEDGTPIALWPEKEKSLVESFRNPGTNNQVFFIDTSGALCSRSSGHAVDVEGDRLVLRHRRPVSLPFPNAYSHPLPRFKYSSQTGEIAVEFASDPAYPPPGTQASSAWREKTFLLTTVPLRKPKTIIDNAAEFISSNIFAPISLLAGSHAPPPARPDELLNADIDLTEEEIVDEEKGDEAEIDDSAELGRRVKIVTVPTQEKKMMDLLLTEKARNRRRWMVTPLRTKQAKTVSP